VKEIACANAYRFGSGLTAHWQQLQLCDDYCTDYYTVCGIALQLPTDYCVHHSYYSKTNTVYSNSKEPCYGYRQSAYTTTIVNTISDAVSTSSSSISRTLGADDNFQPPPLSAPGVIEAEYFGTGGQNISYYNIYKGEPNTASNSVRKSNITIDPYDKKRPKANLGYIVGWTGPGEWMMYNNVSTGYICTMQLFIVSMLCRLYVQQDADSAVYRNDMQLSHIDICIISTLMHTHMYAYIYIYLVCCASQVTALKSVRLTVQYRLSRGLKAAACQFSLLVDPIVPDDVSTLCTSTLNNKVCTELCLAYIHLKSV
jgi:hypothetical protein